MKILMVNTPDSQRFGGGDLVQLRKTSEALRLLGVDVAESFDREPDARGFDLVHLFNLRTLHVTPTQVQSLKRSGVPIVLSPIYLNPAFPFWATRLVNQIFSKASTDQELARLLDEFRDYKLRVQQPGGVILTAHAPNRPRPDYDEIQRDILRQIAHVVPNSLLEMNALVKTLRLHLPYTIAPYAADPKTFLDPDPEPFIKKHGIRDFVLEVGRLEPSKNQVMLAYALRELDLPLVLIGGQMNKAYISWCRKYGPKNLTIIPHLAPDELASAYAAARVHVLPSWVETCGLVSMEAALADCSLVVSIAGFELEYYRDLAYYCDPADTASIRDAVVRAYENYERDALRRLRLKELILRDYTWLRAAERCLDAYRQVLGQKVTS